MITLICVLIYPDSLHCRFFCITLPCVDKGVLHGKGLRFIPSEPETDNSGAGIVTLFYRLLCTSVSANELFNRSLSRILMKRYIPVLSIAGSDCSGGAGIQADIKTISAIGCYAMTAITALTVQNTTGVSAIGEVSPEIVEAQIEAIWSDIPPLAVKTGMLFNRGVVEAVARSLERHKPQCLVVDPVSVSTSGSLLLQRDAIDSLIQQILPHSLIITPNVREARELTGETEPDSQAARLREMGCRNILLKGGDADTPGVKIDLLYLEGASEPLGFKADEVVTRNTHGTGCTMSSAIACYLALGMSVDEAVGRAKLFITRALQTGARVAIGEGHGPVNHLFGPRHMKFSLSNSNHNRK